MKSGLPLSVFDTLCCNISLLIQSFLGNNDGHNDNFNDDNDDDPSVSPAPPLVSSSCKLSPASPAQPEELIMEIKRLRDRSVVRKIRSHLSQCQEFMGRDELFIVSFLSQAVQYIHLWNKFN